MGEYHLVARSFTSKRRYLLLILAGSFLLRLGLLIHLSASDPAQFLTNDSTSYINSARALHQTGSFAVSPESPDVPQTVRTPGYPVLIAGVYALFGERNAPVVFVQVLLSVGTLILVFVVARNRWGPGVAVWATLILALDQVSLAFSLKILTETLFTFLLFAMLATIATISDSSRAAGRAVLAGLLLALATMVRPISYYLILPMVLALPLSGRFRKRSLRRASDACLLLLLPFVLLVGGWQVRNYQRTGSVELSTIQGRNLLLYRGAGIVALRDGIGFEQAREQLERQHPDETTWTREGVRLIARHPLLFIRTQATGAGKMLLGTGHPDLLEAAGIHLGPRGAIGDILRLTPTDYFEKWIVGSPVAFGAFVTLFLYVLLVWAGVLLWFFKDVIVCRRVGWWDVCMWGTLLYIVLMSAGPEAYPRFRVPIMPILALYAAKGIRSV